MKTIDFVVALVGDYVGFISTNIPHPIKGVKKGESCVDCAKMLREEYGSLITVGADISKDVYKYNIMFRELTPKDRIYLNKITYMCKQEENAENMAKRAANLNKLIINHYER